MKKKDVFYTIAIVVLIIILIGLIAVVIINNQTKKAENEKKEEVVEVSSFNYDSRIAKDLQKVASDFDQMYQEYQLTNLNILTTKMTNFNALSNTDKLNLVGHYFDHNRDIEGYSGKTFDDKLTPSDFDNYFKNVFQEPITYKNENLLCDKVDNTTHCHVSFNKDKNYYEYNSKVKEHDQTEVVEYYSKLIDAKKEDNTYTLTYVKVFGEVSDTRESDFYDEYNITDKSLKVASKPTDVDGYDPVKVIADAFSKITNYDKYHKYSYKVTINNNKMYLLSYDFTK